MILEVRNLTKKFGDFNAVDNLSFTLKKGEIVGFIGKNGAGKSTTIKAILNFIKPTNGKIFVHGLDSQKDNKKIKENTSYMSSDVAFYQTISAKELFMFIHQITGVILDDMLELSKYFELDIDKKISDLSLGNRKKVGIIQTLIQNHDLLIFDEPTNGLDPLMQEKFFTLILKKKSEGKTIFLSSHNLSELEKYCDRAIIIKNGRIIDDIDLSTTKLKKGVIVSYTLLNGESIEYDYEGDINDLIGELSKMKLESLIIKNKSIEDSFIEYYQEDK